jgi:amino acid transporter
MGRDKEMPSILGLLHGKYATPHFGVLALALVSMIFGAYGVLSVDNLTQITLASNTGTFLVYGMTNLIVLVAFWGKAQHNVIKHIIVPSVGFLANLAMLGAIVYLNLQAGGSTKTDTIIAIGIVLVWIAAGVVYLVINSATGKRSILHKEHPGRTTEEAAEPESTPVSAMEARAF